MYILYGGPDYGATTQIIDRWDSLPARSQGGANTTYSYGALNKAWAAWVYKSGTSFSYTATIGKRGGGTCVAATSARAWTYCTSNNFVGDIAFGTNYNGYKTGSAGETTIEWSAATGLSITPQRSTVGNNTQFYHATGANSLTAYTLSSNGTNAETSYIDLEVDGIADYHELYISDFGSSDPSRFEIVNEKFVRIYLIAATDGLLGNCSISIAQRFVGSVLRVTPKCSDVSLAAQAKNVGTFSVAATNAGGEAISVSFTTDASTGAIQFQMPKGGSCLVSYSIKSEHSRLWYLDGISGNVVAAVSDVPDTASGSPLDYDFYVARRPLYSVMPSSNPPTGQTSAFAVTSPATPDHRENGVNYYIGGSNITLTVTRGSEEVLTSAYLDTTDGTNFASYTENDIDGDSFTIVGISRSCLVRGVLAVRQYAATCEADDASKDAFDSLTASPASGPSGTVVTFTATPKTSDGYEFEGWYINGSPAPDSTIVADNVSTTYHYDDATYKAAITADTQLVAKAKVPVSLDVNGSGRLTVDGEVVELPFSRDVTLGGSVSFAAESTESGSYFLLWYESDGTTPVYDYGRSGVITPNAPVDMVAKFGNVDPNAPVTISIGLVARNDGREGSAKVTYTRYGEQDETEVVVGKAGAIITAQGSSTVTLVANPKNGWVIDAWYADATGQGTPISRDDSYSFSAYQFYEMYVVFKRDTHSICEWEGGDEPKTMTWRSKTYEASKPFNPSACRVDALGYAGDGEGSVLELKVDMFSAPNVNAKPTASTTLTNIANQNARRLPVRRMERYMQVQIKANVEIDTLLVGTSMEGLAQ